jgi:glucosylceramidase
MLPSDKQAEFLKAFYDANNGIGYSLMRTNMNSCDFSSGSYTYVREGDSTLASFNIDHDRQFKLPLIKKAFETAGNQMTLFVSPWSPPAFMKDNNHMLRGGKLLPNYYQAWANYFVKFINAYQSEGVPVWGVTIQNEPMAVQKWESCVFTAEEERDFLKYYLGPTFKKYGLANKKIIVWDHNRDLMGHRANVIFGDKQAAQYAWGIGYHWYEKWSGGESLFDNVDRTAEMYPDKPVLFTEGCIEKFDSTKYHYWPNAERYGREMINDLNNGTVGWCDWNILLDQYGGPNHVGNFCFAPVHANTTTGELIYTPTYYYIGHFSKFVKPNAKRISTMVSRSALSGVSFANSNGSMASVVMNSSDKPVKYRLVVGNKQAEVSIAPHAIQTIVY